MVYHDLAIILWPDRESHRYSSNGGPPGCYMALSAALRRGGFFVNYDGAGSGHRTVYARPAALASKPGGEGDDA